MTKEKAIMKKAEWLAYCLKIGFIEKPQLDALSALWDKYKDENGNIKPVKVEDYPPQTPLEKAVADYLGYPHFTEIDSDLRDVVKFAERYLKTGG